MIRMYLCNDSLIVTCVFIDSIGRVTAIPVLLILRCSFKSIYLVRLIFMHAYGEYGRVI